uniref:Latrophilin Cirl n=1 Tax=Bactrocera latifrons TaxID=174628 RepID=A0A0K8WL40_BACLA
MFPKSLTVLNSKCAHKQSCSVLATTSMFGDPCPGTHKYLEAHYQCISAAQTSTTTNRPSPPWVLANNPPLLANGSTLINPSVPLQPQGPGRLPLPANGGIPSAGGLWHTLPPTPGPPQPTLPGGRLKGNYNTTVIKNSNRHDGLPPPPPLHHHHHTGHHAATPVEGVNAADSTVSNTRPTAKNDLSTRTPGTNQTKSHVGPSNTTTTPNTRILSGVGGSGTDDGTILTAKTAQNRGNQQQSTATQQHAAGNNNNNVMGAEASGGSNGIRTINNINNLNMGLGAVAEDESNMFCGPTNARNLFWNITRVGDVNVQPCPGGATGIAKWRCVLMKRVNYKEEDGGIAETTTMRAIPRTNCSSSSGNSSCENAADRLSQRIGNFEPTWHPMTPDLTQCRSLWLNSLEVRVNQRESSVISIANDLSEVTSSKTLYGGDMLVTTKIIQTMSEKMFHDKETLPDQRQREAIILELLHGVVKTGSNLLDESQLSSWMDLNQEDQMRVATSLLTGLEYNAFLLADTIIRERNIVQKVKNILLSVRVLETKNIQGNEVFPDLEQWQISDDRIELPRTALVENSEGGLVRIVFAAFDRLESILKPSYDHFDTKSSRSYVRNTALLASERNDSGASADLQQQRIRILNSKVISASLGKGRHIQLSQPIKLVLRHIKTENVTNPTCVFWNYIDHAWSANGCTLESTNRTHSICMCNHLTNFAILMDVMDEHNHSLFGVFDGNMRILIYISVAICLVFVVIALLTLKIFNGVFIKVSGRRNRRGGGGSQIGGGSQRQRSSRRQNNIRDQTHETLAITTTTSATAATASGGQPAPTNNIQNIQQQLNLQHIPNIMGAVAGGHLGTTAPTNFIQHNSIRNSNRNNLNANNFNLQQQAAAAQQQQQQQQQQVVAAAAAAVVVAQHNQRNLQMNNLNLNLNLQPPHHHNPHGHNLNQPATSTHMHVSTATAHTTPHHGSMETSMSNTTSVAAMAAAATIAAALQHAGSNNNLNVNRNNSNNNVGANNRLSDANTNTNNIIMQGNMEDLQYKWWWW